MHVIVWFISANPLLSKFNTIPRLILFKKEDATYRKEMTNLRCYTVGFFFSPCSFNFILHMKKEGGEIKNIFIITKKNLSLDRWCGKGFNPRQ